MKTPKNLNFHLQKRELDKDKDKNNQQKSKMSTFLSYYIQPENPRNRKNMKIRE